MSLLVSLLAAVVVFIAGWAVIKRYPTVIVLFAAGLIMIGLAILFGADSILPKNAKTTGLIWFDAIDIIRLAAIKQVAGIGMIIMVAGGFAKYMETIGASGALVHACISPLKALHSPYIVLGLCYLVGAAMVPVVPSHGGMAMLLLTTMYPILLNLGVSKAGAAAAIFCSGTIGMGPGTGTALYAAKIADIEPIALLCIFSKFGYSAIQLNTVTALLLSWVIGVIVELIRVRNVKQVFQDAMAMIKGMGSLFSTIVALIIAAEVFATGIKLCGLITLLLDGANAGGLGITGMSAVLSGLIAVVSFLTGSGVGALTSLGSIATDVANGLGGNVTQLISSMQFTAGLARGISPVAGATIVVAAAAGVSPIAIVRRTAIPMAGAWIVMMIENYLLLN